jgi:hypothetical protein
VPRPVCALVPPSQKHEIEDSGRSLSCAEEKQPDHLTTYSLPVFSGARWGTLGALSDVRSIGPRGSAHAHRQCVIHSRRVLPHYNRAKVYNANNGVRARLLIRMRAMRCTTCGAELSLTSVVQDAVPGVEHHSFICSDCHVKERRVVLMRHGREDDSAPMPVHAAPPIAPASAVRDAHIAPQGLFGRVVARIRGATRVTFGTQ